MGSMAKLPQPGVVFVVPEVVAHELVAAEQASYHFRPTRTGEELLPIIVVAATTAVVTVTATQITEQLVRSLVVAIKNWWQRRSESEPGRPVEPTTVRIGAATKTVLAIEVTGASDVDALTTAILDAVRESMRTPDPESGDHRE
jgi:hypothetical protein